MQLVNNDFYLHEGRKQHSRKGITRVKSDDSHRFERLEHEMFGGLSTGTVVDAVDTKINIITVSVLKFSLLENNPT